MTDSAVFDNSKTQNSAQDFRFHWLNTQKLFISVFYSSLLFQSTFQSKELCSMFRTPEVRSYFSSLDLWIYNF